MWPLRPGGPDWTPITPKTGSLLHADSQMGDMVQEALDTFIQEKVKWTPSAGPLNHRF